MKIKTSARLAISAIVLPFIVSCGGGTAPDEPARARPMVGGIGGSGIRMGVLAMSLVDAPACGFDAVDITVQGVRVNQKAQAGDTDAGWVDIALPQPQRVDLLGLTNGVSLALGETTLPAGTYTQLRLVLAANDGTDPLANSVVPTGGSELALTTPGAQRSGLKANVDIRVSDGKRADYVIDFDACKSIVATGGSTYLLKPVLQVSAGKPAVGENTP
jgi:hypothetical protein